MLENNTGGGFLYFPAYCNAQDLTCTVSREANGQTTYRIPDFNQSACQISWTDVSKFVLATQEQEKDGNVLFKNETTLITRVCMETVLYRRDCISEENVQEATCNTTCTGPAGLVTEKGPHTHETVIYVAVAILALLIVVITSVAVWFRNNIRVCAGDFLRRLHPYLPPCPRMTYTPTPGQPEDDNV